MKIFLVSIALIVAVQALSEEQKKKMEKFTAECMEESKLDKNVLEDAYKGVFSDDPKLKVHVLCFSKKLNFQNEKGDLQEDVIKAKLGPQMKNEEEVKKLMEKCVVQKDTPLLTSFEMMKCFHQNLPKEVSVV